jgi:trehalose 2-sulfotransferase
MDQPPFSGTFSSYCIATTPRSGSTLLGDLLRQNRHGVPHEYFQTKGHMKTLAERFGVMRNADDRNILDFDRYVDRLKRYRTTPNGWFGFKVFWEDFAWMCDNKVLDHLLSSTQYIYLYREDFLAQAVSLLIAGQSGRWNSLQSSSGKLRYDSDKIIYNIRWLKEYNRQWRQWLELSNQPYIVVSYEALLADSTHVAEKLAVFLDQDKPFNFDLNTAIVQRQSNFINTLWISKFRAENENFLDAIQQ